MRGFFESPCSPRCLCGVGDILFTGSQDGDIMIWDLNNLQHLGNARVRLRLRAGLNVLPTNGVARRWPTR